MPFLLLDSPRLAPSLHVFDRSAIYSRGHRHNTAPAILLVNTSKRLVGVGIRCNTTTTMGGTPRKNRSKITSHDGGNDLFLVPELTPLALTVSVRHLHSFVHLICMLQCTLTQRTRRTALAVVARSGCHIASVPNREALSVPVFVLYLGLFHWRIETPTSSTIAVTLSFRNLLRPFS